MKTQLLFITIATTLMVGMAGETDYYERYTAASKSKFGFLSDDSLVQTNIFGPFLTNAVISWSKLTKEGEFSGIRLGMTMLEVVDAWGKPNFLFTHCAIGPRMWYGTNQWHKAGFTLFFRSNILVVIAITGESAEHARIDNGLDGKMGRGECEALLGSPTLRNPDAREGVYIGDIAYRLGKIRTDIAFDRESPNEKEHVRSIAICLESEVVRPRRVEQDAAAPPKH